MIAFQKGMKKISYATDPTEVLCGFVVCWGFLF